MALSVIEKYSDSWRLNFGDFSDVSQTTFAVGTIADVKTLQDNPIVPTSLVKVQVPGGQESDWIPLFFTPKLNYWDLCPDWATDLLSQDINPDALNENPNPADFYFKTAWTSFCPGDQVKVVLQNGVAIAVVGFADGVPRIGENIVKFVVSGLDYGIPDEESWYTAFGSPGGGPGEWASNQSDTGPDGNSLCLAKPYTPTVGADVTQTMTYWQSVGSFTSGFFVFDSSGAYLGIAGPGTPAGSSFQAFELMAFLKYTLTQHNTPISFGPVQVGPVDFQFNYNASREDIDYDQVIYLYLFIGPMETGAPPGESVGPIYPSPSYTPADVPPPLNNTDYDVDPASWALLDNAGSFTLVASLTGWPSGGGPWDYYYSGPYGSSLLCQFDTPSYPPPNEPNIDWTVQMNPMNGTPSPSGVMAGIHGKTLQSQFVSFNVGWGDQTDLTKTTIFVRPHTKADLQANDMWPAGLSDG